MPSTPKSNRLKRKRGKKFVWHGDNATEDNKTQAVPNPFEEHSKVKNASRDLEKRKGLL